MKNSWNRTDSWTVNKCPGSILRWYSQFHTGHSVGLEAEREEQRPSPKWQSSSGARVIDEKPDGEQNVSPQNMPLWHNNYLS